MAITGDSHMATSGDFFMATDTPLFAARRGEYGVIYRVIGPRLVIEVDSGVHRRDAYHP